MATFSTNVIEMPDLASRAYQMYQLGLSQQEKADEKAKLEREKASLKRERYSDVEGSRSMLDKAYSLEPAAREVATVLFKEFENASIDFNTTGSEQSKSRLDDLRGKLNRVIGQGMAISDQKKRESEEYRLNPQLFTPESSSVFSERKKSPSSFKPRKDENGNIIGTYNGEDMPIMDIPYFGDEIIPGLNAIGLDRIDRTIEILNPDALADKALQYFSNVKGVRQDFGSSVTFNKDKLIELSESWLDEELSSPGAKEKVFIAHAANMGGIDPGKLSRAEYLRILDKYKNPELAKSALEKYKQGVLNKISSRAPASQIGAAGGGGGKSDMSFLDLLGSVGFDQPYFEGGGQRGATGIRRLVFPTDISVAVGTDPLNLFSGGRHIIKGVGFDRNGKVYFRVQDEKRNVIERDQFAYNAYMAKIREVLDKNNAYNILKDFSKRILTEGSNPDWAGDAESQLRQGK